MCVREEQIGGQLTYKIISQRLIRKCMLRQECVRMCLEEGLQLSLFLAMSKGKKTNSCSNTE